MEFSLTFLRGGVQQATPKFFGIIFFFTFLWILGIYTYEVSCDTSNSRLKIQQINLKPPTGGRFF